MSTGKESYHVLTWAIGIFVAIGTAVQSFNIWQMRDLYKLQMDVAAKVGEMGKEVAVLKIEHGSRLHTVEKLLGVDK